MKKTMKQQITIEQDKLNRVKIVEKLLNIIDIQKSEGSFVIGIDSGFGTGKTYFLKIFENYVKKNPQYKTIHFNAWENDDIEDPLLAFVGEIEKIDKNLFNRLDIGKIMFSILNQGIKSFTGVDIQKTAEKNSQFTASFGHDQYKKYKERQKGKEDLKQKLEEFKIKLFEKDKTEKIIFLIDELDRCKPTFAIELLERMKHFFDIKNIIFVLAIDKEQLKHSIATIYGENMDSIGYLRRFIDFELNLPEPKNDEYINYLMDQNIKLFNKLDASINAFTEFAKYIKQFAKEEKMTLRDLNKLFNFLKLFSEQIAELFKKQTNLFHYIHVPSFILAFLLVIKFKRETLYKHIIFEKQEQIIDLSQEEMNNLDEEIQTIVNPLQHYRKTKNIEKTIIKTFIEINRLYRINSEMLKGYTKFYNKFEYHYLYNEYFSKSITDDTKKSNYYFNKEIPNDISKELIYIDDIVRSPEERLEIRELIKNIYSEFKENNFYIIDKIKNLLLQFEME